MLNINRLSFRNFGGRIVNGRQIPRHTADIVMNGKHTAVVGANMTGKTTLLQGAISLLDPSASRSGSSEGEGRSFTDYVAKDGAATVVGIEFAKSNKADSFMAVMAASLADGDSLHRFFVVMTPEQFDESPLASMKPVSFSSLRQWLRNATFNGLAPTFYETQNEWRSALAARGVGRGAVDALSRWAQREGGLDAVFTGVSSDASFLTSLLGIVVDADMAKSAMTDIAQAAIKSASGPALREQYAAITAVVPVAEGLVEQASAAQHANDALRSVVSSAANVRAYVQREAACAVEAAAEKRAAMDEITPRLESTRSEISQNSQLKNDAAYQVAAESLRSANEIKASATADRNRGQQRLEAAGMIEVLRRKSVVAAEVMENNTTLAKKSVALAPLHKKVASASASVHAAGARDAEAAQRDADQASAEVTQAGKDAAQAQREGGAAAQAAAQAQRDADTAQAKEHTLSAQLAALGVVRKVIEVEADIDNAETNLSKLQSSAVDVDVSIEAATLELRTATADCAKTEASIAAQQQLVDKHAQEAQRLLALPEVASLNALTPAMVVDTLAASEVAIQERMATQQLNAQTVKVSINSVERHGVTGVDSSADLVVAKLHAAGIRSARPFMAWAAAAMTAEAVRALDTAVAMGVYVPTMVDVEAAAALKVEVARPVVVSCPQTVSGQRRGHVIDAGAGFYDTAAATAERDQSESRLTDMSHQLANTREELARLSSALTQCRTWAAAEPINGKRVDDLSALRREMAEQTAAVATLDAQLYELKDTRDDLAQSIASTSAALRGLNTELRNAQRAGDLIERIEEESARAQSRLEDAQIAMEQREAALMAHAAAEERRSQAQAALDMARSRKIEVANSLRGVPVLEHKGDAVELSLVEAVATYETAARILESHEKGDLSALRERVRGGMDELSRIEATLGSADAAVMALAVELSASTTDAGSLEHEARNMIDKASQAFESATNQAGYAQGRMDVAKAAGGSNRQLDDAHATLTEATDRAEVLARELSTLLAQESQVREAIHKLDALAANHKANDSILAAAQVEVGGEAVEADVGSVLTQLRLARERAERTAENAQSAAVALSGKIRSGTVFPASLSEEVYRARASLHTVDAAQKICDTVKRVHTFVGEEIEGLTEKMNGTIAAITAYVEAAVMAARAPERLKLHDRPLMRSRLGTVMRSEGLRDVVRAQVESRGERVEDVKSDAAAIREFCKFCTNVVMSAAGGSSRRDALRFEIQHVTGSGYEVVGAMTTSGAEKFTPAALLAVAILAEASGGGGALLLENPFGKATTPVLWSVILGAARDWGVQLVTFSAIDNSELLAQFGVVHGMRRGANGNTEHFAGELNAVA